MLQANKNYVVPQMKMMYIMQENPYTMLMMQHFEIDFRVGDFTVSDVCKQYRIDEKLFIMVVNLYYGFRPKASVDYSDEDVLHIIRFLKNSHNYYRFEKYPEISQYIHQLQESNPEKEMELLEVFFNEYFSEVIEHLDYEDNVAFPYFVSLIDRNYKDMKTSPYSSKEYGEHHTDIELKLKDLKNLLIHHISIKENISLRRKLLTALFELEFDLYIHSLIEDTILIPLGIEKEKILNA